MARNSSAGYNGNPNLPLPSATVALNAQELAEYAKCEQDVIYFIQNYVKIVHVDDGIIKFKLWKFQEDIIKLLEDNRFVICKLPRQSGKSTVIICGYFLWYILFQTDVSVALLANKETTAIQLMDRLKQSYELLPDFLKQGVVKWDQKLIKLANNNRVRAEATSAAAIRGDSFNIVFMDEFAFVPANIANEFMASVYPVISSGKTTKLFIVSTPNGYNMFHKIWQDSINKKNTYVNYHCTWRDVPGRDEAWAEETRKNIGSEQKFQQEFECDFLGSANSLVAPWKIAQLHYVDPIEVKGNLRIFEKPVYITEEGPSHTYVMTVDVAQGQEMDSSVIMVTDVSTNPFRQVAVFEDNTIKPAQLAVMCRDIGRYYNSAYMLVEINGEGLMVADMLITDLEYEGVIQIYPDPKKGQRISSGFNPKARYGLKTSENTKRIGSTGLKSLIENDRLLIRDWTTIEQLSRYVAKPNTKGLPTVYEAEEGNHDDHCSALVLLGWLTAQQQFENYIGVNMRKFLTEGVDPIPLEVPFFGFADAGPRVLDVNPQGFEVVEDTDNFWG